MAEVDLQAAACGAVRSAGECGMMAVASRRRVWSGRAGALSAEASSTAQVIGAGLKEMGRRHNKSLQPTC